MKRKIWVISPLMYLMAVVMVALSFLSYNNDKIIFSIELTISGLFLLAVLIIGLHFRSHVSLAMRSSKKILTPDGEEDVNSLPLSTVVVGLKGDIVWSNSLFMSLVTDDKGALGDSILPYIYPRTLKQVCQEKGTSVATSTKEFTVYATRTSDSYVMYFVDDTYFKQIHREYHEKKPVVAIISFDNKEELTRDLSGGDESRITVEVESILYQWATETMGGFLKKMSGGRYLLITDDNHFEKEMKRKFEILDNIRKIKSLSNLSATISIGAGLGASTSKESESWARKALEMALGRGGDQVAIMKKGGTYEFYGGLSKGIEKRDKVRTRVIASTLSANINNSDRVFIMGHKNSDLDSVGSAVGVWAAVTKSLGRKAEIVVNRNQTMALQLIEMVETEKKSKNIFITPNEALQNVTENSLLIVVDTHSTNFVESTELLAAVKRVVVIDHHRMMVTHIRDSVIFYHEPFASSASEMVAELIQYMENTNLDSTESESLLAGIMLDTKNFVLKTGVRTFEAAGYLRRKGADTVKVKKLFANNFSTNKEKSSLVANATVYKGCAISSTRETSSSIRIAAAQAADELLSIQDVRASFVIFRIGNDVNLSGRSLGDVNVQLIMEEFGGGGHLTMAGAQIKNVSVEEARDALIEVLDNKLVQSSKSTKK